MNEKFEKALYNALMEELGEGAVIDFHVTMKNNGTSYRAVSVMQKNSRVAPNFRVDEYKKSFEEGRMTMDEIVSEMMDHVEKSRTMTCQKVERFSDFEEAGNDVYIRLISKGANAERLKSIPHRDFLDLALVYYYAIFDEENGINGLIVIDNSHLKMWGISEEELFKKARENTEKKLSHVLLRLDKCLFNREVDNMDIYFLSNKRSYNGAVNMFYPSVLREAADKLDSDLYIIPSSIHELIILRKTNDEDTEVINNMIREVNRDYVEPDEVLSDHVYVYNRNTLSIR